MNRTNTNAAATGTGRQKTRKWKRFFFRITPEVAVAKIQERRFSIIRIQSLNQFNCIWNN